MAGIITTVVFNPAMGQQNIIMNKDNTRPEVTRQFNEQAMDQARVSNLQIVKNNGYNELNWTALMDKDSRGFIAEYSIDGTSYLTAGTAVYADGAYIVKHYTNERRPVMYRIRSERLDGTYNYSPVTIFDGVDQPPVRLQSTVVRGNVVNVIADRPVQRINVFSRDGIQVYARDVNGQQDYISTVLPTLNKGMYFINFYGDGWKNTQKIVVL